MALGMVNMPVDAVTISHLQDVSDATVVAASKSVILTWADPDDLTYEGATLAQWVGTIVIRKESSAPISRFDGDVVVDSTIKNQYASTGYVDTGLTNGTVYYYRFFPYDSMNNYRPGTKLSAQPAAIQIALPTVTGDITYDGTEQSPTITYNSEAVTIVTDTSVTAATNANTEDNPAYSITFALKDDTYIWEDGTYTNKTLTWAIAPEELTKPTIVSGQESLVYNSNFQSPDLNNFVATKMEQATLSQHARITVGNYTMIIVLSSTNYKWIGEDISVREVQLSWAITKADHTLVFSADSATIVYGQSDTFTITTNTSGGELSYSIVAADQPYVSASISGNTVTVSCKAYRATSATVTITSAATANYNASSKNFTVLLQKAAGSMSLSSNSVTLTTSATSQEITVTRSGDGIISATSSDSSNSIVTVSSINQETGKFTITGIATGSVTITVVVTAGSNHTAPVNQTISVSVSFAKAFSDCTWAEIQQIVQQGKWEENGWAVGDTKDMQFPSAVTLDSRSIPANTTYKVVILGFNHNPTYEGTNTLHCCIGKDATGKEICFYSHEMNSSSTNSGGWNRSAMKTWLNGTFYNALPTDLKNVITECTKYTDNTGNSSNTEGNVTSTSQKIWLMAEFEVFGSRTGASQYEQNKQAQYDYYKNGNSRVRYQHGNQSSAGNWWLRSPRSGSSTSFRYVDTNGAGNYSDAVYTNGVVPGFTIS